MVPACNPAFTLPRDSGAPAYIHKQTLALRHVELGTRSTDSRELWVALHSVTCPRASLRAEAGGRGIQQSRRRVRGQRAPPNVGQSLDDPLSPLTRGGPRSPPCGPLAPPACERLLATRHNPSLPLPCPPEEPWSDRFLSFPQRQQFAFRQDTWAPAASREARGISVHRPLS